MTDTLRQAALDILATEYADRLVLDRPGSKLPAFKGWLERGETVASVNYWFDRRAFNLGLKVGNGLLVVDYESEKAVRAARKLGVPRARTVSITYRCRHEFFRCLTEGPTVIKWRGLDVDLKRTGQVVIPPSHRSDVGHVYRWMRGLRPIAELTEFPPELLEPAAQTRKVAAAAVRPPRRTVRNPRAYVLRIESHEGSGGSNGLVRAVAVLRDCGWQPREILTFLVGEWNREPRVSPIWTVEEIERAVVRHAGPI